MSWTPKPSWSAGSCYKTVEIESRTVAVAFYEKLGYSVVDGHVGMSGVFACIRMRKQLCCQNRHI